MSQRALRFSVNLTGNKGHCKIKCEGHSPTFTSLADSHLKKTAALDDFSASKAACTPGTPGTPGAPGTPGLREERNRSWRKLSLHKFVTPRAIELQRDSTKGITESGSPSIHFPQPGKMKGTPQHAEQNQVSTIDPCLPKRLPTFASPRIWEGAATRDAR